jgi:hypothetical protein
LAKDILWTAEQIQNANTGKIGEYGLEMETSILRLTEQIDTRLHAEDDVMRSLEGLNAAFENGSGSFTTMQDFMMRNFDSFGLLEKAMENSSEDFDGFLTNLRASGEDAGDVFSETMHRIQGSTEELEKQQVFAANAAEAFGEEALQSVKNAKAARRAMAEKAGGAPGLMTQLNKAMPAVLAVVGGAAMSLGKHFFDRTTELTTAGLESGFTTGGMSGINRLAEVSAATGAAADEIQTVIGQNRQALIGLTRDALITSTAAHGIMQDYGQVILTTFGKRGKDQIEMVGRGITALTAMGQRADAGTFDRFMQGIEDMGKVSDMSATEIFREFEDMAQDPNFQGLLMSMGQSADVTTLLSDEFMNLATNVGMNATEFMKYRKQLNEERNRTGVERVVQGAVAGDMVSMLGLSGQIDPDLIQRGRAHRESLSKPERDLFDEQWNKMRLAFTQQMAEARASGNTFNQTLLNTTGGLAGMTDDLASLGLRELTGTPEEIKAQFLKIIAASQKKTDADMAMLMQVDETLQGVDKNPWGKAIILNENFQKELNESVSDIMGKDSVFAQTLGTLGGGLASLANVAYDGIAYGFANAGRSATMLAKVLGRYFNESEVMGMTESEKKQEQLDIIDTEIAKFQEHMATNQKARNEVIREYVENEETLGKMNKDEREALIMRYQQEKAALINKENLYSEKLEAAMKLRDEKALEVREQQLIESGELLELQKLREEKQAKAMEEQNKTTKELLNATTDQTTQVVESNQTAVLDQSASAVPASHPAGSQ